MFIHFLYIFINTPFCISLRYKAAFRIYFFIDKLLEKYFSDNVLMILFFFCFYAYKQGTIQKCLPI